MKMSVMPLSSLHFPLLSRPVASLCLAILPEWMSWWMLAVSSSNHRQRSGRNLADGHAIPWSGLLLTTWQTPTLGFRKQERMLRTGSTGGCLWSIAQRTRSGACSYWIGYKYFSTAAAAPPPICSTCAQCSKSKIILHCWEWSFCDYVGDYRER